MAPIEVSTILLTFGGLFILGLLADLLGRHTLPRVTLLIVAGVIIGPSILNWLPSFTQDWFPVLTDIALAMIGFMLGQSLTKKRLSEMGKPILSISVSVMIFTSTFMFLGLILLGAPIELALILAGIAPATAPAPVVDVVQEVDAKGPYTGTLLGIVAVDDAWGMILFSLLLVIASIIVGQGSALESFLMGGWDILGSILIGIVLGFPMAYITSHLYPGKSSQAEVLGLVMLCAGVSEWLEVSYILSSMVMGLIVANFTKHHKKRVFKEIETFEWPLLILFFLLAGASLDLNAINSIGLLGAGYILFRILGRLAGSFFGTQWCQSCFTSLPQNKHTVKPQDAIKLYRWMGLGLLPHAGIPIGMALFAIQYFPEHQATILAIILGSAILFELIGPPLTRHLLIKSGETRPNQKR